jgi:hypothetical protein
MTQPYAISKVVESDIDIIVVAKSKDYSIYSHVYRSLNMHLKRGLKVCVPFFKSKEVTDGQ